MPRGPRAAAKCLTMLSIAPLVAAYAAMTFMPAVDRCASEERKTTLLPFPRIGQQPLDEKIRRAHIYSEEVVEILDRHFLDRHSPSYPRVGDDDVEPFPHQLAYLGRKSMGPLWGSEVNADSIRVAA